MTRFQPGGTYGVLHMHDTPERVTIATRDASTVTLTDGRHARILSGVAPDGSDEELLRLDESGAVALGGVVRACALVGEQQ